jgi:hypothetical protein
MYFKIKIEIAFGFLSTQSFSPTRDVFFFLEKVWGPEAKMRTTFSTLVLAVGPRHAPLSTQFPSHNKFPQRHLVELSRTRRLVPGSKFPSNFLEFKIGKIR